MQPMKKRVAALFLTGATLVSGFGGVLAYDEMKAQQQAEALKTMGLFLGTDQGFELQRTPSRMDALIMLLRMTGQEDEARFYEGDQPFVDAPSWGSATAYLAYAYNKGLTNGVDETHFAPSAPVTAQAYVTFMLRALGYTEESVFTQWDKLAKQIGLLPSGVDTKNFLRGDVVLVSYAALDCRMKDSSTTLQEKLMQDKVFSSFAKSSADLKAGALVSKDSSLPLIAAYVYQNVSEHLSPDRMKATEISKDNMSFFLGVDTIKIDEGFAVEPMMTTQAHSVCLVRLSAGQDVEAAKAAILKNINPFKWICVGVEKENVRVDNIGNLIVLIMDNNFDDALLKNFKSLPLDAKGAVRVGDTIVEKQTLNEKSLTNFAEKLNTLQKSYMEANQVYYSVIPDKSYYVKKDFSSYLDHEKMMKTLSPLVSDKMQEITLTDTLDIEDYYRTDLHWRQENLDGVIARMGEKMGFSVDWKTFSPQTSNDFIGSYRRVLDSLSPETFTYLKSPSTDATQVSIYGQTKPTAVYDTSKLSSKDPYTVFLSELSPLTVLKNPDAPNSRRLVLFSDSFGTSFAPLLLEAYSEITMVDLRFMASSLIPEHVNFKDADVLFLYSAQIANNSQLLR